MTSNIEELYQQHTDFIFGPKDIDAMSEEETDLAFDRLLRILPNNGKLYKYRSFDSDKFENYYKALKDGYLYMPKANELNDDLDVVVKYTKETLEKDVKETIDNNLVGYIMASINAVEISNISSEVAGCLLKYVNVSTRKIDKNMAVLALNIDYKIPQKVAIKMIEEVEEIISEPNMEKIKEEVINNSLSFNKQARDMLHIYSMSESYQIDPMWALYAGNNNGFCIEYDYKKAKTIDYRQKKLLLFTFKEEYEDDEPEFSFSNDIKYFVGGGKDIELKKAASKEMFLQARTKRTDWENEREWRIMLSYLDEKKIYIDLVSKIIIDERAVTTNEAQKLIGLCKERGWSVMIRKVDYNAKKHMYCDYEI